MLTLNKHQDFIFYFLHLTETLNIANKWVTHVHVLINKLHTHAHTYFICVRVYVYMLTNGIPKSSVYLFWPNSQVKVEASLEQQILHIIWVDCEVEVQRVS